jgi:tryptophan synthase beta chain
VAIDEALRCKAEGKAQTIVFNLSGHGHFDLASYEKYLTGQLEDFEYPADKIAESMACLPKVG